MKYTIIAIVVLISVGVFLYNKDEKSSAVNNTTQETSEAYKIVAFGDSLTAGYGVKLEESYPSILEKYLKVENPNIEIVNMGVSGETTTGGLDRVDFVISQNPQLVLLGLGANDMLRSTDPEITKGNLEKMILAFKQKNIPIVLMGMKAQASSGFSYKRKFDSIYADLAKKHDVALVPYFLENVVLVRSLNIDDGIHPNREGYEKIAQENVLPVVRKVLKNEFGN